MAYVAGLAVIGVAGSIVPLATDPRDAARHAADQRADAAETAGADAAAASRESERAGKMREEDLAVEIAEREENHAVEIAGLTAEIEGLEGDDADLRSSKAEFELYTDAEEQWRWRLVHDNGNVIADGGQGYSSERDARRGLGSVKLNALGAAIDEL